MKQLNVVVSFVIALLFIRNQELVGLVNRFLPNVSIFMIIILMFLLLVGIFVGKEHSGCTGNIMGLAFFVSLIFHCLLNYFVSDQHHNFSILLC